MTWVATAVVGGAAVIGAGASFVASSQQASAAEQATASQSSAQSQELAFLRQQEQDIRRDITQATQRGVRDIETGFSEAARQTRPLLDLGPLEQARGFLEDPSQVGQLPGVEFQRQEGVRALQNAFSRTSGGGLSGDAIRASTEFGQNFASTQLDQALNRLIPFINLDQQARSSLANIESQRGTSLANLRLGGATRTGAVGQSFAPGIAGGISNVGNIQAAGAINQANIGTQLTSNLLGIGGDLANLAIQQPSLFSTQQQLPAPAPSPRSFVNPNTPVLT